MTNYKAINPTGTHILVLRDAPEEMSELGIALPGTGRQEKFTGVVVGAGPDSSYTVYKEASPQRVLFARYAGMELDDKIDGVEGPFVLLDDKDILATVE